MVLGDYLELWLDTYIAPGRAHSTYTGYRQALRHLAGDTMAAELGDHALPLMMQRDIYALAKRYSRQAQVLYAVLHSAMGRAVRMGYVDVSPMGRVDKPHHQRRAMRWLTRAQLADYLGAAAQDPEYVRLALMAVCGLRRGEALAVTPESVDAARRVLHVRQQIQRGRLCVVKTATSARDVPLQRGMLGLLLGRDEYGTTSASQLARAHARVVAAAGVPAVTPHELRHTCASTMICAGVPMMVVQRYLGHSSYQVTADIYGHVAGDDLRAAAGVIDDYVGVWQQSMAL